MNLVQFTKEVDKLISEISEDELRKIILELARVYPENQRSIFMKVLKAHTSEEKPAVSGFQKYFAEDTKNKIEDIHEKLEQINHGDLCLDSKYNEEWDDWYNSDDEEIIFSDPCGITKIIDEAIRLVNRCADIGMTDAGYKLAYELSLLNITAEGDYEDYNGEPLCIRDLDCYELITCDYVRFAYDSLYLAYLNSKLEERAAVLFGMLKNLKFPSVKLENIFQMGVGELPDAEVFPEIWLCYLLDRDNRSVTVDELATEAFELIADDERKLDTAGKYAEIYPSFYKEYIESNNSDSRRMYKVGMVAMSKIPRHFTVRRDISLLTAEHALILEMKKEAETCWLEAFRSVPDAENYWRIRLMSENWKQYSDEMNLVFEERENQERYQGYLYSIQKTERIITNRDYGEYLLYEGRFDDFEKECQKESDLLHSLLYREKIKFLLIGLYNGELFSDIIQETCHKIGSLNEIFADRFYKGTLQSSETLKSNLLVRICTEWKKGFVFTDEQKKDYLTETEKYISEYVSDVMRTTQRTLYGECALLVAALGEVLTSLGKADSRNDAITEYKRKYPRHSSFRKELDKYETETVKLKMRYSFEF